MTTTTNRFFSFNNPVLWVAAIVLFPVTLLVIGFMVVRAICGAFARREAPTFPQGYDDISRVDVSYDKVICNPGRYLTAESMYGLDRNPDDD